MNARDASGPMMRKIRGATRGGVVAAFVMMLLLGVPAAGQAEDNPALWKREVKDNYAAVLEDVKSALEANQFSITGESDLAKALAKNRHVFGQGKWNTIGFQEATAVSFCSLLFNQEVFNLNMDYSILCPFKVVLYSLESRPGMVTILMVRPTYLLAHFKDPSAREIGQKIEDRIVWALDEALKH